MVVFAAPAEQTAHPRPPRRAAAAADS